MATIDELPIDDQITTSVGDGLLAELPGALRRLRLEAGLSQRGVADIIRERSGANATQAMISQWELGHQLPALASLVAFLEALGLSFRDLHHAILRAGEPLDVFPPGAVEGRLARLEIDLRVTLEGFDERLRSLERRGRFGVGK